MEYLQLFIDSYQNYAQYLWNEITRPSWHNYFYWLIGVSAFFLILEWLTPWRKNQAKFRKDFWLDFFYMFFNFFLFSLIIYHAASNVVVNLFTDALASIGITNLLAIKVQALPIWAHLLIGFVVRDFVQWWIHRLLHRSDFLWEFHKVHHSVEEMGFAAHLRYHWMENVVYKTLEYLPLALIGIGLNDFFVIHIFTLIVGHYNHANIRVSGRISAGVLGILIGIFSAGFLNWAWWYDVALILASGLLCSILLHSFMKYIFNSPEMHIWHHSYHLPEEKRYGVNFALTLAIWDYLFGTVYIPHDGRDIRLGFPELEKYPKDFIHQSLHGFSGEGNNP